MLVLRTHRSPTNDIVLLQETLLCSHNLHSINSIHSDFYAGGCTSIDSSERVIMGRPYGGVPVTEPTFSEPTVTKPIPRSRHPVRRHATEPTFTEPIFFLAKLVIVLIVVLQRVILQSPRLDNDDGCLGVEFTNKT